MIRGSEVYPAPVRELVRRVRLLRAGRGSNAPAIGLLPSTFKDLARADDPVRVLDACRRALHALDRQEIAERVQPPDETRASVGQGALRSTERSEFLRLLWADLDMTVTVIEGGAADG